MRGRAEDCSTQQRPSGRTRDHEDQALRHQLPGEAAAAGAERGANGELALSLGGADQHERRYVPAHHEERAADQACNQEEQTADAADRARQDTRFAERHELDRELVVGRGEAFGKRVRGCRKRLIRLFERDASAQAPVDSEHAELALEERAFRLQERNHHAELRDRNPELGAVLEVESTEGRRSHADDGERLAVHGDDAAEASGAELGTRDSNGLAFEWSERAAFARLNSDHVKVVSADHLCADWLGAATVIENGVDVHPIGQRFDGFGSGGEVLDVGIGGEGVREPSLRVHVEGEEAVGLADRERAVERGVEDAPEGGGGADAEGEGHHGSPGEGAV
ncbi:MAG: hypothetical protein U0Q16_09045 [Bryobacteraceae bacterium]